MKTYATKQENKTVCASCGRAYLQIITGVANGEGAEGCPHCTPQGATQVISGELFSDGARKAVAETFLGGRKADEESKKKSGKKK